MESQTTPASSVSKTKRKQRIYALFIALVLIVLAAAIFKVTSDDKPNQSAVARIAVVRITDDGFEPSTLSVKQGTRIIWTNADSGLHQIAANPYPKGTDLKGLKSEILNNAQTYTYTADTVGSFGYHDQLKPTINGTLVVKK